MLWDVPNDPRGELRWCLSKIRPLVDEPGRQRLHANRDAVSLDLPDCLVDVAQVLRATSDRTGENASMLGLDDLRALARQFRGDLLEGLEIDRCPVFTAWLVAERRRFRTRHAALLELPARQAPDEEVFEALETLVRITPYDLQVHTFLLDALARQGRLRDGEQHVEAAAKLFEADGLDVAPLRKAWNVAKAGGGPGAGNAIAAPQEPARASAVRAPAITPADDADAQTLPTPAPRRASIAVMPFAEGGAADDAAAGLAGALVHDIITRLAKLRSLFVIAQGTVFALHARGIGSENSGRLLGVDYVVRRRRGRGGGAPVLASAQLQKAALQSCLVCSEQLFTSISEIA